jgi:glutamine synthetase type III
MSVDNKTKNLDKAVKEILNEKSKENPRVITNGSGVGLSLNSDAVKKALLFTIKKSTAN